jgi:hypothetical protein
VFIILAAGRLGQDMLHPAGAGLAGSFSVRRGATFLAVFIAVGSVGFGLSQLGFRTAYNHLGHHTEILLIPAAILWVFVWVWCRPAEALHSGKISLISSLRSLRPVAGPILLLFLILSISQGVLNGLFFLMPEFAHEKGYPAWLGQGGGFWADHLRRDDVHGAHGPPGRPHRQASDADCNHHPVGCQLPCHGPSDAIGAGVHPALHCGRCVFGNGESIRCIVWTADRATGKYEHRFGDPDGLGMVPEQHGAQHSRRTLYAPGSQCFAGSGAAWVCQCLNGPDEFFAAENYSPGGLDIQTGQTKKAGPGLRPGPAAHGRRSISS